MEPFVHKGTQDLPEVELDKKKKKFKIAGRSCPENVSAFYVHIFDWLKEYEKNPLDKTIFEFEMIYYNTASAKMLLNIMQRLENMHESGQDVKIKWYYPDDDDDLFESGEDYQAMLDVPIELIDYEY